MKSFKNIFIFVLLLNSFSLCWISQSLKIILAPLETVSTVEHNRAIDTFLSHRMQQFALLYIKQARRIFFCSSISNEDTILKKSSLEINFEKMG